MSLLNPQPQRGSVRVVRLLINRDLINIIIVITHTGFGSADPYVWRSSGG